MQVFKPSVSDEEAVLPLGHAFEIRKACKDEVCSLIPTAANNIVLDSSSPLAFKRLLCID